jgi:hypothetical protein
MFKFQRNTGKEPSPNPLDFPVKDPLREACQGRWKQLPFIQKVGLIVVLGFWCTFIAANLFGVGRAHLLNRLLPLISGTAFLGLLLFLMKRVNR